MFQNIFILWRSRQYYYYLVLLKTKNYKLIRFRWGVEIFIYNDIS